MVRVEYGKGLKQFMFTLLSGGIVATTDALGVDQAKAWLSLAKPQFSWLESGLSKKRLGLA